MKSMKMLPALALLLAALPLQAEVWAVDPALEAEAVAFLPAGDWQGAERVVASRRQGLVLVDGKGKEVRRQAGRFSGLDSRALGQGLALASYDRERQQVSVLPLMPETGFGPALRLPVADYAVEDVCLYRDAQSNLYAFVVGEEGRGEQWLVGRGEALLAEAKAVRSLSLPPAASRCRAEDAGDRLYVNEEGIGLWAYEAHPESDGLRAPVDLVQPFGGLDKGAAALAVVPGGVLAVDGGVVHAYRAGTDGFSAAPGLRLAGVESGEALAAQWRDGHLSILARDDEDGRFHETTLAWAAPQAAAPAALPVLLPEAQTEPVRSQGDAADDPAIWVHADDPARSRILATDKKRGLEVYDLAGQRLQSLPVGDINNVDLRYGFRFGGEILDIAVAGNRVDNSLNVFGIDRTSGEVRELGKLATPLKDIYGICLYSPRPGEIHALPNDKDGTILQYRLSGKGGKLSATLLRTLRLPSQPEGCVADDRNHRLFVGEEDQAIWSVSAEPKAPGRFERVLGKGRWLHPDIEGMGLYHGADASYLLVSSQGNDSYVVLDAAPPHAPRGAFRIGLNAAAGIDGASETDGLEVSSANLGGAYGRGLVVVQDGRKRLPAGRQNFKLLPWQAVAEALRLP